jgi:hypothetical protein
MTNELQQLPFNMIIFPSHCEFQGISNNIFEADAAFNLMGYVKNCSIGKSSSNNVIVQGFCCDIGTFASKNIICNWGTHINIKDGCYGNKIYSVQGSNDHNIQIQDIIVGYHINGKQIQIPADATDPIVYEANNTKHIILD